MRCHREKCMAIFKLGDKQPVLTPGAWVAESAEVIGDVVLGEDTSIWSGVIIRADNEQISIGCGSNVQESAVLHSDPGSPLTIGSNVTVGHQAMLHGCTVGDGSLIGVSAVVLNGARIGRHCLVGAGALVTKNKVFEDGQLIVGSPAKAVRALTPDQIEGLRASAAHYVQNAKRFATSLMPLQVGTGESNNKAAAADA